MLNDLEKRETEPVAGVEAATPNTKSPKTGTGGVGVNGLLPAGSVAVDGALVFKRSADLSVPVGITGAGSLTQSAMLHIGHSGRVDAGAVARALRLLRSTSPSSLLLASLDGARRQLALHGEQLLWETIQAIGVARQKLETIPGIAMVDAALVGRGCAAAVLRGGVDELSGPVTSEDRRGG